MFTFASRKVTLLGGYVPHDSAQLAMWFRIHRLSALGLRQTVAYLHVIAGLSRWARTCAVQMGLLPEARAMLVKKAKVSPTT